MYISPLTVNVLSAVGPPSPTTNVPNEPVEVDEPLTLPANRAEES